MKTLRQTLFVLSLFHLGGCASNLQTHDLLSQPPDELARSHTILAVPFFPQELYQCGPAALATLLNYQGLNTSPEALQPLVYIPGQQGSYQLELLAATRSFGKLAYPLDETLGDLLAEVNAGNPVLVLQNLALSVFPQWHFAVVKGFDLNRETVILNSGTIEDYELALTTFERTWRRADYWAFTALTPGQVPVTANPSRYFLSLTDFQQSSNDQEAIKEAYRAGIRRWPEYANLSMAYGNFLYAQDELQAAAEVLQALIQQDNSYAPAYNNLAHVLFEMEDYQAAFSYAETAIQIGGDENPAYSSTYRMIEEKLQELSGP